MHNEKKLSDVKGNIDEFFKSQFDPIPGTEESGGRQLFISKNQKARFGRLVERKDKSFLERYFCNQNSFIKKCRVFKRAVQSNLSNIKTIGIGRWRDCLCGMDGKYLYHAD